MRRVTFSVSSWEDLKDRTLAAFRGEEQGHHMSFASPELMWDALSEGRWRLLSLLTGQPPMTVEELANQTGRDRVSVEADLIRLANGGVIDRAEGGRFSFPYDEIHFDFVVRKAA